MQIVHSRHHALHASDQLAPDGLPLLGWEVPGRAEVILKALQAAGLGPIVAPADHGLAPILAVHDPGYVQYLESAAAQAVDGPVVPQTFAGRRPLRKPTSLVGRAGYYAFGTGAPVLPGTWQAAYWSVQCALTAVDLISAGREDCRAAYALCRPPGHHAGSDLHGGYCYLNNAAAAARTLQRRQAVRVAILDVDCHHGNGTQAIFYADADVLYCSLHADPDHAYPYYWGGADEVGEGEAAGTNRNWPLPAGTGDARYLAALDEALDAVRAFSPGYLVVSAGFDTVDGDPEGGFCLTPAGISEIGRRIAALALPAVIVQEGGYRLECLGDLAVSFLRSFADESKQPRQVVRNGGTDDQSAIR